MKKVHRLRLVFAVEKNGNVIVDKPIKNIIDNLIIICNFRDEANELNYLSKEGIESLLTNFDTEKNYTYVEIKIEESYIAGSL